MNEWLSGCAKNVIFNFLIQFYKIFIKCRPSVSTEMNEWMNESEIICYSNIFKTWNVAKKEEWMREKLWDRHTCGISFSLIQKQVHYLLIQTVESVVINCCIIIHIHSQLLFFLYFFIILYSFYATDNNNLYWNTSSERMKRKNRKSIIFRVVMRTFNQFYTATTMSILSCLSKKLFFCQFVWES